MQSRNYFLLSRRSLLPPSFVGNTRVLMHGIFYLGEIKIMMTIEIIIVMIVWLLFLSQLQISSFYFICMIERFILCIIWSYSSNSGLKSQQQKKTVLKMSLVSLFLTKFWRSDWFLDLLRALVCEACLCYLLYKRLTWSHSS